MSARRPPPFDFLPADSVTAAEIAAVDWAATPLGPAAQWPAALRSLLATLFDTPQPMFVSAEPGRISFFNDLYRPVLGARLAGAIGKPFEALWHDIWHVLEPDVMAALEGRGVMHVDLPLRLTRYGYDEDTWWTFSYAPVRDEHGAIIGMYAIINETTRSVRTALALRELNAALESQVGQRTRERDQVWAISRDLYVIATRDGHYLDVNPAWGNELGYGPGELLGVTFEELVHPDDLDRARDAISLLTEGDMVDDLELRMRAKDGSYRWFAWSAVPDGDVVYGMGRDTQRRRDMEEQLRHAQKLEALGRLTGGIAHDFNNILGGIGGAIEVVGERIQQGRVAGSERLLQAASDAVGRAAGLTHRLLAYSRQQPLSLTDVDANEIVRSLNMLIRPVLGERVHLQLDMQDGLWRTFSDASQLESAVLNLVINARDAMPEGGTVSVRTRNQSGVDLGKGAGDYVVVSVRDTGTGMSRSVREKAFDPFFTTKPIGRGTGLGLSMVDGFARQTGGRAIIESTPGQGTEVSLWLPRCGGTAAPVTQAPAKRPAAGAQRHVLLVEDEEMLRSLVREVLEQHGYRVSECTDGPSALLRLDHGEPPDVLLTDIGLPGLDGYQLALRARERWPALPVLFISGYAWDAMGSEATLPTGSTLLAKPFALHTLVEVLDTLLEPGAH
jgi:PAS domain S-box-containing protein